jgi:phosphomannomutase
MAEPIISVSGLRGIIGETLSPELAIRYVAAYATTVPHGPILVGRDSRPSGDLLSRAILAAIQATGRTAIDAGICATPTLGVLVKKYQAAGAIQITASHNPPPYNGLKLFSGEGRVIPAGPGEEVLKRYRASQADWANHERLGSLEECEDSHADHLEAVLETVDVDRIREKKFAVVLDSNNGAGSPLGRRLLEALGCTITVMGEPTDGAFGHPAEPTAENLADVLVEVPRADACVGFCQDPDADRLALIDEGGRYIGEEYTVALIAKHILGKRKGPIVTNCSSSRMTQDLTESFGQPFFRSAVGEANVVDMMLAKDAIFGGEGNGGPIDPRVGLVRDSFVGMAQILDLMSARDMPLSELADELPRYEIVKTKIPVAQDRVPAALDALEKAFDDARGDRLDGLRLDWPNGTWLLVRASNTEPIVRACAEATDRQRAAQLCEKAAQIIEQLS